MKKSILSSLLILLTAFLMNAQTEGVLTVTTTTSETGGNFAPKNIVSVWIEDDSGNFVKTLLAYAQTQIGHLNIWEASTTAAGSLFNVVDAITGATQSSHGTRVCSWNGTDINSITVTDGAYKVWMELTDKNSTGNYSSFNFTKNTNPENQTPADVPSFSSISIVWTPDASISADINYSKSYNIHPNPTSDEFKITGENILGIEITNVFGDIIYKSNSSVINISRQPKGIYLVKIKTDKGTITKKIIKQ